MGVGPWYKITLKFKPLSFPLSSQIQEPLSQQKSRLAASQQLQQFLRDVEDEEAWVKEREPLAASQNTGKDLTAVQSLQKKHQAVTVSIDFDTN